MKYRLMDLLACPICKTFPLLLHVFKESEIEVSRNVTRTCEEYCGFEGKFIRGINNLRCNICFSKEIIEGIIICQHCNRWYPIIDEIPHMLPDDLRNKDDDILFLKSHIDKIPERILYQGKPFHL